MWKKLTHDEIKKVLSKIRQKYEILISDYNKSSTILENFEDRYISALQNKMDLSVFLLAEIEAVEELINKEEKDLYIQSIHDTQLFNLFKCMSKTILNEDYKSGLNELKTILDTTYKEGNNTTGTEFSIMFEVDGELKEYKINDVTNITFTPRVEPVSTETSVVGTSVLIIPANTKITASVCHPAGS